MKTGIRDTGAFSSIERADAGRPGTGAAASSCGRAAEAPQDEREADAIVVLGCALAPDGGASPALRRRVLAGTQAWLAGRAPLLILSGGGGGPRAEAEAMREVAIASGADPSALRLESRSRNTFENFRLSAPLVPGRRRIVIATEGYHLRRARLHADRAGLRVVGTAAAGTPWPNTLTLRLREAAALAEAYWLYRTRPR